MLLVEDDEVFRRTIRKTLEKLQCEVSEADNGKRAKEMILLEKYGLVVSDIQMPHFTGIDLLEWIKATAPVPTVLMTGFSQALETKRAHDLGADGFLPKPFTESDLRAVIQQFTKEEKEEAPSQPSDLDNHYCKISVDDFLSEKETAFDIYVRISATKYIKIAHTGGKISEDRIQAYKEKGVHFVYVKKEDFPRIVRFNLRVAKAATKSAAIDCEKKLGFMKHVGQLILENTFVNGVNQESFLETKQFVETSMDVMTDDDQVSSMLDILSSHADFLYAHSLGVSMFSVMIAKELGWTASATLFKLSMGGLLHDIGKKEIEREILEKPRPLLTQKERALIETHTTRGKEILEALGNIPSEVVTIAYQHHEDMIGQGFPRRIAKHEMHPLAKVVQVANIFCEYAVKCRPDVVPMAGPAAINTMETMKLEMMDKESFAALKRLF